MSSRAEKKVMKRLTELGIEAYVPLKREKRQWSDRMKWVEIPLMPGYVFVRVDAQLRESVFKADGVVNYVRYNGADAIVRQTEIDTLRSIAAKGYHVEGSFGESLMAGDPVMVAHGPFKGLLGTVEKGGQSDVLRIQIASIGYTLRVTVPREVIQKV